MARDRGEPKFRAKTYRDYEALLRRYVRPVLGSRPVWYHVLFALALTTGMRPSEYLALKWTMCICSYRGWSGGPSSTRPAAPTFFKAMRRATRRLIVGFL